MGALPVCPRVAGCSGKPTGDARIANPLTDLWYAVERASFGATPQRRATRLHSNAERGNEKRGAGRGQTGNTPVALANDEESEARTGNSSSQGSVHNYADPKSMKSLAIEIIKQVRNDYGEAEIERKINEDFDFDSLGFWTNITIERSRAIVETHGMEFSKSHEDVIKDAVEWIIQYEDPSFMETVIEDFMISRGYCANDAFEKAREEVESWGLEFTEEHDLVASQWTSDLQEHFQRNDIKVVFSSLIKINHLGKSITLSDLGLRGPSEFPINGLHAHTFELLEDGVPEFIVCMSLVGFLLTTTWLTNESDLSKGEVDHLKTFVPVAADILNEYGVEKSARLRSHWSEALGIWN